MKNNLIKIFILFTGLISDFALFSQPNGDTAAGDLEGNDAPAAPINSKLFILAIIGLFFATYTFKRNRRIVQ